MNEMWKSRFLLSHPSDKIKDAASGHPMDEDENPYPWGPRNGGAPKFAFRLIVRPTPQRGMALLGLPERRIAPS
jgi:hypothetical protein